MDINGSHIINICFIAAPDEQFMKGKSKSSCFDTSPKLQALYGHRFLKICLRRQHASPKKSSF